MASVPASCDITLTCNKAGGISVSETFTNFRIVGTQTGAPPVLAEPTGFTNCVSVGFGDPVNRGVLAVDALLAGLAVNVEYTLTLKSE